MTSVLGMFDDLFVGYEQTTDSAIVEVNSMAFWPHFPRLITHNEAHQLYMRWFVEWFIPWFEWLKTQQS